MYMTSPILFWHNFILKDERKRWHKTKSSVLKSSWVFFFCIGRIAILYKWLKCATSELPDGLELRGKKHTLTCGKPFPLRYKLSIHSTLSGTEEETQHLVDEIEKNIMISFSKILFRVFSRLMNVPVHKIITFLCDVKVSIYINHDCFILEANMV